VENLSPLTQRIISTVILLPVAVTLTMWGGWWFVAMACVLGTIVVAEYHKLVEGRMFSLMTAEHALTLLAAAVLAAIDEAVAAIGIVILGTLFATYMADRRGEPRRWPLMGVPYVAVPLVALIWLRLGETNGLARTLWLLSVVWATDIGAYVCGRLIGGPKLLPAVSPKKTWAGLFGGMLAAAVVGLGVGWGTGGPTGHGLVIASAVLAAWSQVGDLAESALKRRFNAKDSGNIIPGHGGVLDRVDGLLFAAPAAILFIWFEDSLRAVWG